MLEQIKYIIWWKFWLRKLIFYIKKNYFLATLHGQEGSISPKRIVDCLLSTCKDSKPVLVKKNIFKFLKKYFLVILHTQDGILVLSPVFCSILISQSFRVSPILVSNIYFNIFELKKKKLATSCMGKKSLFVQNVLSTVFYLPAKFQSLVSFPLENVFSNFEKKNMFWQPCM